MKKQKIYITDNEAAFILTILGREASDVDKKVFVLIVTLFAKCKVKLFYSEFQLI